MELITILYIIDIISSLSYTVMSVFFLSMSLFVILIVFYALTYMDIEDRLAKNIKKLLKYAFIIAITSGIINIFLPSKVTLYGYATIKTTEKIAETPEFEKFRKVLNDKLDGIIAEIDKKK